MVKLMPNIRLFRKDSLGSSTSAPTQDVAGTTTASTATASTLASDVSFGLTTVQKLPTPTRMQEGQAAPAPSGPASLGRSTPAESAEARKATSPGAAAAAGGGAKGKAKGKKGPPPPAAAKGAQAESAEAVETSPAAGGKGPKGPGPPGAKGGPPAPKGKGRSVSAGPGGGKGRGAANLAPTRDEKEAWVGKATNPLRWQRKLGLQVPEGCVFSAGESSIDLAALEECFARSNARERPGRAGSMAPERVERPLLWDSTETQDPKKRRTTITILMVRWEKVSDAFLDRLKRLEYQEILQDKDFNQDIFEQLVAMVKNISPAEWAKLREEDAESRYEWSPTTEGFFRRLQSMSYFQERLSGLHGHIVIERELGKLSAQVSHLATGMQAVQGCEALGCFLRKLLHVGNCLNAGSGPLGRADGFDAVTLLEKTILIDMPKGSDGKTSLLQYMKEREVCSEHREAFGELERQLRGWKLYSPSEEEQDDDLANVLNLKDDLGRVSQTLSRLEGDLAAAILRHQSAGRSSGSVSHRGEFSSRDLGGSRRRHCVDRGTLLQRYDIRLQEFRYKVSALHGNLEALETALPRLHAWLLHAVPDSASDRRRLSAGRTLGVMAQLAHRLAPEKEADAPRRVASATPRHGASNTTPRAATPRQRRASSVDSVITNPVAHSPPRQQRVSLPSPRASAAKRTTTPRPPVARAVQRAREGTE